VHRLDPMLMRRHRGKRRGGQQRRGHPVGSGPSSLNSLVPRKQNGIWLWYVSTGQSEYWQVRSYVVVDLFVDSAGVVHQRQHLPY